MKDIFENVINSGDFELKDILNKIDESYIKNKITKEEKEQLEVKARTNANPQNSYAENSVLIAELFERVKKLENAVFTEDAPTEEVVEEYPNYVQPTGAHDSYNTGDKITYNDKKYTCIMDNCVWSPETYPNAWELIEG